MPKISKLASASSVGASDLLVIVQSGVTKKVTKSALVTASGAVTGPASSTDNAITRFDLTTGKLLQDSVVTVSDTGVINTPTGGAYQINSSDVVDQDVTSGSSPTFNSITHTPIAAPAHAEGLVYYDSTKKALSYYNDESDVTLNIGQELYTRVYNNTVSTIINGAVVYIDGSATGLPSIALAQPDEYTKSRIIGMATHSIEAGSSGYVTKFGVVGGLNTDTYTVGDPLYLTDDGALTTTLPTGGDYNILIGVVIVDDPTDGEIFVNPCVAQLTTEITDTNGFPSSQRTGTTLSVVDSTRTFTIAPTGAEFYYYLDGYKYIKTASEDVVFADTEGLWVFYYDNGTLTALNAPTTAQIDTVLRTKCIVAYLHWDATNKISSYLGDERHGILMSPSTHTYLHFTRGAQFLSGIALSMTSEGDGNSDVSLKTSSEAGYIVDEDITTALDAKAVSSQIPVYYKSGASALWRRQYVTDVWAADTVYSAGAKVIAATGNASTRGLIFRTVAGGTSGGSEPTWQDASGAVDADGGNPCGASTTDNTVTWVCVGSIYSRLINFVGGTYLPAYNQFTGGAWQQTEVISNNYVLIHYFATNDLNEPLICIQGEESYVNVITARTGANNEISAITGGALPFAEFTPIATVICQSNSAYANFAKARVRESESGVDYVDWRFQELVPGGGVSDHGNLSGLGDDDHQQYTLVDGTRAFTGTVSFADNTVSRPKLIDVSETVSALGDLGGGTDDIDLESGNVVTATVSTGEQTFTFSNPPASGSNGSFTLFLTNGGSQTVNWPASVDWVSATAPSLTASGVDVLVFTTNDAGTTWLGFVAGLDVS